MKGIELTARSCEQCKSALYISGVVIIYLGSAPLHLHTICSHIGPRCSRINPTLADLLPRFRHLVEIPSNICPYSSS